MKRLNFNRYGGSWSNNTFNSYSSINYDWRVIKWNISLGFLLIIK